MTARLCYVDDSRTSAYVVKRLLQPFGYQVEHFSSAEPAFVALVQDNYDLLLTDLKVSATGMDGDDLIRSLRQSGHPKISTLPIIVITGTTDAEVLVGVYDAGANQVMKKPVDGDELDGHIRRLLSAARPVDASLAEPPVAEVSHRSSDNTVVPLPTAHRSPRDPSLDADSPQSVDVTDIPVLSTITHAADEIAPDNEPEEGDASEETHQQDASTGTEPAELEDSSIVRAMEQATGNVAAAGQETGQASELTGEAGNAAAQTAAEDFIVNHSVHRGAEKTDEEEVVIIEPDMPAGKRGRAAGAVEEHGILHEIEQYPLVINERRGVLERSGLLNMLHSLLEVVGARGLLIRAIGVLLVLALLVFGWRSYFDEGIPVDTVVVESGEIFQSITVPGRVVSKQQVNVSSARAGRLVKVLVKEGDRVTQGQLLAQVDDRELLSRLRRAQANLSDARGGISLAERTLARLRKAHAKGAVARRFVEDAEADLRSARTRAGIAVEEVRGATLDLDNLKITAAFDGTVTARHAEIGQWVGPTEALFTLVDESQREIEARVDAADSVAIAEGQVVAVSSDAFPDLEWQESVLRLGTATDNKRNANTVKVYISLGSDAPQLRFGQQVDADIRTAWNPNTLKVPFEALITRDGQTMVAVLEDGRARLKIVQTGIEDFSMAEIKQGLNEGEVLVFRKGVALQNGDRVHPRQDGE